MSRAIVRPARRPRPPVLPSLGGVAALGLLAACQDPSTGPRPTDAVRAPQTSAAPDERTSRDQRELIPGRYIVVLKGDAGIADVRTSAQSLATRYGATADRFYDTALQGFAAAMDSASAAAMAKDPAVASVEQDAIVRGVATQSPVTWGLDRTDQRLRPLSNTFTYNTTASQVTAYIIDSGLRPTHTEFAPAGRAVNMFDAWGGSGLDCHGHGTHVGGTVGGRAYGVAKNVRLRGVRVLDCGNSGSWSGVIAGIDWVAARHVKPAIANLSLGGPFNAAVNAAVVNLASRGVFVVVAAGNSNQNACDFSPASATPVTTVAASDRLDRHVLTPTWGSNWGSCVDLYAPGLDVTSAWRTSDTAIATIGGTSMASPHVAGVAALYKARFGDASQATIDAWLKANATVGALAGVPAGTPNRLLFKSTL